MNYTHYQVANAVYSDLLNDTQKLLVNLTTNFNALCGDLDCQLNSYQSNGLQNIGDIVSDLQCRMNDVENYLNYIADVSNKLVTLSEKLNYSYYTKPIKDEFGNILEDYSCSYSTPASDPDELLRIDTHGNIWINGTIETSATTIGNVIKSLAEQYRENTPVNSMADLNL